MTKEDLNKDLPLGATPYTDDISGLKLTITSGQTLKRKDVYDAEADNILSATMKYFSETPNSTIAPFDYYWVLNLHKEMLGEVWTWAGTTRS